MEMEVIEQSLELKEVKEKKRIASPLFIALQIDLIEV